MLPTHTYTLTNNRSALSDRLVIETAKGARPYFTASLFWDERQKCGRVPFFVDSLPTGETS
jgi:hypothetical protein